jgi:hypothetical protein
MHIGYFMKNLYLRAENFGTFISEALTTEKNQVSDLLKETLVLNNLKTIPSKYSSIVLVGHSSDQILTKGKNISFMSAQDLAKTISTKYNGDKALLTDFFLISCEAGMSKDKKQSFAEIFSIEMQSKGFNNLRVHAMTPPPDKEVSGMIVQTHGTVNDDLYISAWAYNQQKDEEEDVKLTQTLQGKLQSLEYKEQEYNNRTKKNSQKESGDIIALRQKNTQLRSEISALNKEIKDIEIQQNKLRLYTCRNQPYKEALSEPSNTIFPTLSSELPDSTKATTDDNTSNESYYLLLLTAKDGIFSKIVSYFQGTNDFTEQLAMNLKVILHEERQLEIEKIGIIQKIQEIFKNQSTTEKCVKVVRGFFSSGSITDTYLKNLLYYVSQKNPQSWALDSIKNGLTAFKEAKKGEIISTEIQPLSDAVLAYTQKRIALNASKQEIKNKMTAFIDEYIQQFAFVTTSDGPNSSRIKDVNFDEDTSEIHQHKVNVMVAIRNYLQSPTPQNWESINKAKSENLQWDKGYFSKVGYVADKLEAFNEAVSPSPSTTPKPR